MTRTFQFGVVAVALSVLGACSDDPKQASVATSAPPLTTVTTSNEPVTSDTTAAPSSLDTVPEPDREPLTSELVTESGQRDRWAWTLTYPVVSGPAGSEPINAAIEGWARQSLDAHMSGALDDLGGEGTVEDFTVDIIVTIGEVGPLLPARLIGNDYTGGAHGSAWVVTMAFDAANGEAVNLDDGLSGDYLATFEAAARAQLTELYAENGGGEADLEPYGSGLAPMPENYAAWTPAADGLHITFQQYQVGPYAIGMPEIVVPWSSLDVRPDGPFASFA